VSRYRARVGDPCPDQCKRACGFALDRNSPTCGALPVAHLVVSFGASDGHLAVLAACGIHVGIARAAGNLVMEHDYTDTCGMPGTRWDFRDNCCVIDDSGVSLAGWAAMAVPA